MNNATSGAVSVTTVHVYSTGQMRLSTIREEKRIDTIACHLLERTRRLLVQHALELFDFELVVDQFRTIVDVVVDRVIVTCRTA